jgi:hypothetical protein
MPVLEPQTRPTESLSPEDSRHETISERAYQLWMERGCPENSAMRDWLEAEDLVFSETLEEWEASTAEDEE